MILTLLLRDEQNSISHIFKFQSKPTIKIHKSAEIWYGII